MKGLAALVVWLAAWAPGAAWAGYTHYWTWRSSPKPAQLAAAVADMQRLVAAQKDVLDIKVPAAVDGGPAASGDGGTLPSVWLAFNGQGQDAHEDFVFPGNTGFNFCKTAQKPYDAVVTAALLVARDHFGPEVLSIESDGAYQEDWKAGAALYARVFDREARDPTSQFSPVAAADPDQRGAGTPRVRDPRWILLLAASLLGMLLLRRL